MKPRIFLATLVILTLTPLTSRAETWQLPTELNDSNTSITFEVDSTFHTVHGSTKNISGSAKLLDKKDPLSIRVDITVPVSPFNTSSESRDERLREVMAADSFPVITFTATRLSSNCTPDKVTTTQPCKGEMSGLLTIRDVAKPVQLPTEISRTEESYTIKGQLPLTWSEYHVEDPSILIARLDPTVTISYETHIAVRH
jgi:polyisoprenoid-binding protein YceI